LQWRYAFQEQVYLPGNPAGRVRHHRKSVGPTPLKEAFVPHHAVDHFMSPAVSKTKCDVG
jgi:hypothetical protein